MQTIVRSILLAEPMAEDFGRCFDGLDRNQMLALADSFRFDRCIRRERLASLIASKTAH